MNVVINADEWVVPWIKQDSIKQLQRELEPQWQQVKDYVDACRSEYRQSGLITIDFNCVNQLLNQCLQDFRNQINTDYKSKFKERQVLMVEQIQQQGISDQEIVDKYLNSSDRAFSKNIAPWLSADLRWIVDRSKINWTEPLFIRNIANNEDLIKRCFDHRLKFWFIDSGYTNFLHGKKKVWHRLVKDHIHHGVSEQYFPTDRLHLFPALPAQWRRKGSKILVVESSPEHYFMQGTTLEKWRQSVTNGIRAVSDRPIEFKSKHGDRKTRTSVYELLKDTKDYYCVVSDSSAAAVEAIWTGTPAVTLGRHITNAVTRKNLTQINDLYREDISAWLAMLSYSQFTFEELCNGTAVALTREFHYA